MFPLSSAARAIRVVGPLLPGVQVYVQFSRPVAGGQGAPPSTQTSTPPTTPPPASAAVPVIVTAAPAASAAPAAGEVMTAEGLTVSVEGDASTSPACSVVGC